MSCSRPSLAHHPPMLEPDVGCHVAVMCAQSVEKSLKGYSYFNGTMPEMSHRPDLPNTEYPWSDAHGIHVPVGHAVFADRQTASQWVIVAKQLANRLHRLVISAELVSL